MDFQTQSVAGAVKETFHAPVTPPGPVTLGHEEILHRPMNLRGWRVRAHFFKRDFLTLPDRIVKFAHGFAGGPAHDGAGDVPEVTGFLRARKNVDDDGFVGAQRAITPFMRVAPWRPPATMVLAARPQACRMAQSITERSFSEVSGMLW